MTGLPEDLCEAGRAYVDAMPKGEIVAFPITGLDTIGLPVWIVAFFPENDDPADLMPYGVGYGTSDAHAALGALGECMEMLSPGMTVPGMKRVRASYDDLVATHGAGSVADPLSLCLPAGSPVRRDTTLEWVESTRLRDGATVLVPIDVVALDRRDLSAGYEPFTTLITNGMGAGPDPDWASGHGLLELLQRDGNGLVFKALDGGVALELPEPPPASVAPILACFEAAGVRVIPKFATDEFGLANVYCVGFERDGRDPPLPIMLTACGEACHPDRERALAKCLCEFAASRVRKAFAHGPSAFVERAAPRGYVARFLRQAGSAVGTQEGRAFATMRDWTVRRPSEIRDWLADSVHAVRHTKPLDDLPSTPTDGSREAGRIARERVEAAGINVLNVDMSLPGSAISVAKTIAPGLEVETMSYGRIGARNTQKLIARNDPLIKFGTPSATLKPVRLPPVALERFGGQPLLDMALLDEIVGPLYPLYREPEAHHVAAALAEVAE